MNPPDASVFNLSPAEKLQLVEDLWDSLAATSADVPVHPWHKEELDRRLAAFEANPSAVVTWEEAKRRLQSRDGQ